MLINCVAYQNGQRLADISVDEISTYIERPDCFVWVALKDPTAAELEKMQREFGLPEAPHVPLFGIVTRLAEQKGLDILAAAIPELLGLDLQIAILGRGDERYERWLQEAGRRDPARLAVRLAFDEGLARRVEAGADAFLMPSRYEPCGLNQLYSLRYGTVPIVRATGGLDDTIDDVEVA